MRLARAADHRARSVVVVAALAAGSLVGFAAGRMAVTEPEGRVPVNGTAGPAMGNVVAAAREDVTTVMIRPHHRGTVKEGRPTEPGSRQP